MVEVGDSSLLQSLARSGNLACETYYKALSRTLVNRARVEAWGPAERSSTADILNLNTCGHSRNTTPSESDEPCLQDILSKHGSFKPERSSTTRCGSSKSKPEPGTPYSSFKGKSGPGSSRYSSSAEEKAVQHSQKDAPQPKCDIDFTMRRIQEYMDKISFQCECYYDSCPTASLSRADKRHLRSFHKGVVVARKPKKKKKKRKKKKKGRAKKPKSYDGSSSSSSSSSSESESESTDSSSESTSPSPFVKPDSNAEHLLGASRFPKDWQRLCEEISQQKDPKHLLGTGSHQKDSQHLVGTSSHQKDSQSVIGTSSRQKDSQHLVGSSSWQKDPQSLVGTSSHQKDSQRLVGSSSWQKNSQHLVGSSSHQQDSQRLFRPVSHQRDSQPLLETSSHQKGSQPLVRTSSWQRDFQSLIGTSSRQKDPPNVLETSSSQEDSLHFLGASNLPKDSQHLLGAGSLHKDSQHMSEASSLQKDSQRLLEAGSLQKNFQGLSEASSSQEDSQAHTSFTQHAVRVANIHWPPCASNVKRGPLVLVPPETDICPWESYHGTSLEKCPPAKSPSLRTIYPLGKSGIEDLLSYDRDSVKSTPLIVIENETSPLSMTVGARKFSDDSRKGSDQSRRSSDPSRRKSVSFAEGGLTGKNLSQNARFNKQTDRQPKPTSKKMGFQPSSCGHVEGLSTFPAGHKQASRKVSTLSVKGKPATLHGKACQTLTEQGIHIVTKPGRYIVRKPQDSSAYLLHVKPGNYVRLNLE